ncbi:hypothetical protein F4212_02245, partial [Candidatus Poribacteria bacterium]|nr:hypothetical protein [Candidatus Poribacteria bacterium]
MRTGVLSKDNIIDYLNDNFINTWIENAELGRTGSLQDPIAKRRKREGTTFNTSHALARTIMKGWVKGSPVDCFIISHDFELMGSVDFNEFLDNMQKPEDEPVAYMQFLKDSLEGKRPGLGDIILTPEQPSQEVIDTYVTSKMAHENYTVIGVDTTAYNEGGTLTVDIRVGKDDAIGLFYLLDGYKKIPTEKVPEGMDPTKWHSQESDEFKNALDALAQSWGIFPGKTGRITYNFDKGQLFKLCATGDQWGGVGGINAFHAKITVEEGEMESLENNETEESKDTTRELHIVLNKENQTQQVLDIFRSPGSGYQDYNVINIDTTVFEDGGVLNIEIEVGGAEPAGSFDLYDEDDQLPTEGIPDALASAWGVLPCETDRITHEFEKGKVFKLGATGDWFSDKGNINA